MNTTIRTFSYSIPWRTLLLLRYLAYRGCKTAVTEAHIDTRHLSECRVYSNFRRRSIDSFVSVPSLEVDSIRTRERVLDHRLRTTLTSQYVINESRDKPKPQRTYVQGVYKSYTVNHNICIYISQCLSNCPNIGSFIAFVVQICISFLFHCVLFCTTNSCK